LLWEAFSDATTESAEDADSAGPDATESAVETEVVRSSRSGQGVLKLDGGTAEVLVP
jgi:hypothetical protein